VRKLALVLFTALLGTLALGGVAFAGSPHFVKSATGITGTTATSLTVAFKEAGLGDELQVHVVLSADVQCVNGGGQDPQAGNKTTFTVDGTFPVQNGQATGELTLVPVLSPPCSPPMTLAFTGVTLTDTTNGITLALVL
jgi:hypothetical protein